MKEQNKELLYLDGMWLRQEHLLNLAMGVGNYAQAEHYLFALLADAVVKGKREAILEVNKVREHYGVKAIPLSDDDLEDDDDLQGKTRLTAADEEAKEQRRLAILLRTMVNGYMLEVNNEGYMYFNAQSLLEGFMVHVGLERLESMTKEEIKDMLNSLKDGSAVKKLQAEVTELKALVDDQKKQIRDLKKTIKELKED